MQNPPRISLDNTIVTSPLYRRSSHRANTSVDADIPPSYYTQNTDSHSNPSMSSSLREKATPPTSPVLRGRSPWRAGDVPVKTKRSRTLGRVAVLLMLLGVLGYAVMGWGVCGEKCAQTTAWLESGARRTGEYVGGGSVLPALHGTDAQHAAVLALVSGSEFTDEMLEQNYEDVQQEQLQQQAQIEEAAQQVVQEETKEDEVTREDMVDAMNGQGDHTNETELVDEKEPEHVHVQSQGVGEGGEVVMGGLDGGGGGGF